MTETHSSAHIETEELRVAVGPEEPLTLRFAGSADTRALGAIEKVLSVFHDRALVETRKEVFVDFRDLYFINSSCFKAFVVWLGRVQDLEDGRQYRIRFISDDDKPWQRRSLGALQCFAVDLVQIETQAPGVGS